MMQKKKCNVPEDERQDVLDALAPLARVDSLAHDGWTSIELR